MAKCKCATRPRIVSSVVQSMKDNNNSRGCSKCQDVCANPICGEPDQLSIFAPLIYDEIGINLCTTFPLGVDIATTYPTVTNATIQVLNATYDYGASNVEIEAITGRPSCYLITLSNISVTFAVRLYDANCRLVDTIFPPAAVYLPPETTAPTYDEDTNPTSVELEIFAPYGLAYDTTGTPAPVLNYIGFTGTNNRVPQGINMYSYGKLLDFSTDDSTVTVGLTLVLQSLYFAGYKVASKGKIETPKGSILSPDNSDCMRFVAGDLLNLAIKPLDLGQPFCEENLKRDCDDGQICGGACNSGAAADSSVVISETTPAPEA